MGIITEAILFKPCNKSEPCCCVFVNFGSVGSDHDLKLMLGERTLPLQKLAELGDAQTIMQDGILGNMIKKVSESES